MIDLASFITTPTAAQVVGLIVTFYLGYQVGWKRGVVAGIREGGDVAISTLQATYEAQDNFRRRIDRPHTDGEARD